MIRRLKYFVFFLICILSFAGQSSPNPETRTIEENYFSEARELPIHGAIQQSWFFLRNNRLWTMDGVVHLDELEWPSWDKGQIPLTLPPLSGKRATVLVLDEKKALISEIPLDAGFSPENFPDPRRAHYQIRLDLERGRARLTSPIYPWPQGRRLSTCKSELTAPRTLELCRSTTKAFLEHRVSDKQKYARIQRPEKLPSTVRNEVQAFEREIATEGRKSGALTTVSRHQGSSLEVEIGFTQYENLPNESVHRQNWGNAQGASSRPTKDEPRSLLYEERAPNGAHLEIFAHYTDLNINRSVESPLLGDRLIHLQLVQNQEVPPGEVRLSESRDRVIRTGLTGLLGPFDLAVFANYNSLSSGRGDRNSFLSLPGARAWYRLRSIDAALWGSFEKNLVSVPSDLDITEIKIGAAKPFFAPGLVGTIGYHQYGLAGQTTASRLGSVNAIALGVSFERRFDAWAPEARGAILFGSSQSLDLQFGLKRMLDGAAANSTYVGCFIGFTGYRGFVTNKLSQRELFTENRVSFGLALGYSGSESRMNID